MVAKSFQEFEMLGEPFLVDKKMYIKVKNPKTGTIRSVRWYTDKEYAKLYPDAVPRSTDPYFKPQKEVLGFTKGYITIFKGDTYRHLDWFRLSICRYAKWWGWYVISTDRIPEDLPEDLEPIQLPWERVGDENGTLKSDDTVKEVIESIIYGDSESSWVGSIGERLELTLTVDRNIPLENYHGHSSMHIMKDVDGNIFIWTTAAKCWAAGTVHHIRGTIKEQKKYKGECQNILTRCTEVKS